MNVLDHGEVRLIDCMADDLKIVNAARISTGKVDPSTFKTFTTKGGQVVTADEQRAHQEAHYPEPTPEKDQRLINYLMTNGHGTPFEHAVFQFFVKAPIFVVREWQRHRIASYNEFSMRYAEVAVETAEFYVPDHVRVPDPANKQGAIVLDDPDNMTGIASAMNQIESWSNEAFLVYRGLIDNGVAREMARMVLPVSIYTKFWFTVNARSLMNFLMLRNAPGAQWEIQQYAQALEAIFEEQMPWTHEAFVASGRRAP